MTTIDGVRVNNYSIRAIKIGNKASAQVREEFKWFNAEHVGKTVSFQQRMTLQKYWSNSNTSLIRLNFVMSSRRAISPNHCSQ